MFSPTRTALCVAVCAALGLAANEASAGCKIIAGSRVCASWITGSEICQVGVDSNQFAAGPGNVTTVQCIVRGLGPVGEGGFITCDDGSLQGVQTCGPPPDLSALAGTGGGGNGVAWAGTNPARQGPKCNHDKFDPHKNPACVEGSPNLGNELLESPVVPLSCNGQGICKATAEVGVPDDATCSNGGALQDFTADSFVGVLIVDTTDGPEGFAQLCTLDPGGHTYTCTDPTQNFDQFGCENPPSD